MTTIGTSRSNLLLPNRISGCQSWRDVRLSTLKAARDGSGSAPTNGGVCGYVSDLVGSANLVADSDANRPTYYSDVQELDPSLPGILFASTSTKLINQANAALFNYSGTQSWTHLYVCQRRNSNHSTNRILWGNYKVGGVYGTNASLGLFLTHNLADATYPLLGFEYFTSGPALTTVNASRGKASGGHPYTIYITTFTASAQKVYQNGELLISATNTLANTTFTSSDYYCLNCLFDGTTVDVNGNAGWFLADAIFNRVLTDIEIERLTHSYAKICGHADYKTSSRKRVIFFGDSYCAGKTSSPISLTNNEGTFAKRLSRYYGCNPIVQSVGAAPLTLAGTNNDIEDYYNNFAAVLTEPDDIAVVIGGANDIRTNDPVSNAAAETFVDSIVDNSDAIITSIVETKSKKAIMVSSPPFTDDLSGGLATEAHGIHNLRDKQLASIGRQNNAFWVDMWDIIRTAGTDYMDDVYESLEADDLHMNSAGHTIIAKKLAEVLRHLEINPAIHPNLVRWYSARTGSTYVNDAAVSSLADRSTSNVAATQGTGTNQPTYKTNVINFAPAIRFDGVNDSLSFTSLNLTAWTIFWIAKFDDYAAVRTILSGSTAKIEHNSATQLKITADDASIQSYKFSTLSDYALCVARSDGNLWINGANYKAKVSSFVPTITFTTIGSTMKGDINDILIFNKKISVSEINDYSAYLTYKHGVIYERIAA